MLQIFSSECIIELRSLLQFLRYICRMQIFSSAWPNVFDLDYESATTDSVTRLSGDHT